MDPSDALRRNPEDFLQDLDHMITDLLSGSSTSSSTELSPSSPPSSHSEPRATAQKRAHSDDTLPTDPSSPCSAKKVKTEHADPSTTDLANMHPSRRAWMEGCASEGESSTEAPGHHTSHSPARDPRLRLNPLMSATAANAVSLGPSGSNSTPTWSTLANTVRRQWDPRKTDLEYEELLKHIRNEQLDGVDRYVPMWNPTSGAKDVKRKTFPFEELPELVRDRIFSFLLVSAEPIEIEFSWLRPFVKGHARVPTVMQKLQAEDGTSYLAPVTWNKLLQDVKTMQDDMLAFKRALETRGVKTKGKRSPARSLTASLLGVSKGVNNDAARIFYRENTFHFSYAPAAWMQLESFLETIGPTNVKHIKNIRIAAPMFHRAIQEDHVEGAILDAISPATRMAVITSPDRDRLLSAITSSATRLLNAGSLESLSVDLEHPMTSDQWSGRYVNDKRMVTVAEAEKHVERKVAGIKALKQLSDMLAAKDEKPKLTLYHFSKASRSDVNQFRHALGSLNKEAEKYGWQVHPRLEDGK